MIFSWLRLKWLGAAAGAALAVLYALLKFQTLKNETLEMQKENAEDALAASQDNIELMGKSNEIREINAMRSDSDLDDRLRKYQRD